MENKEPEITYAMVSSIGKGRSSTIFYILNAGSMQNFSSGWRSSSGFDGRLSPNIAFFEGSLRAKTWPIKAGPDTEFEFWGELGLGIAIVRFVNLLNPDNFPLLGLDGGFCPIWWHINS